MPVLARWYIKAGLVYFVLALVAGVVLAVHPAWAGRLRPVYVHLLTVGWITQLIIGVGYWMFPKVTKARPRGSERLGWASFVLLNAGLILRAIGEPRVASGMQPEFGWVVALSAVLQVIAGWLFVINTWPRIKER
ncbi:cbb3-type cytochrome c oxidase subunit I [Aggregatilinea lenta]|uniref:cbb3-type cytochrome c oxidase subunit I n=1 Tax=Aggregatilinea lenta TaxID=913108 RepID=UPI000E5B3A8B|nr:cbb3-type cytochrome c oxidase subunit I [Aggregatilinea lenta]